MKLASIFVFSIAFSFLGMALFSKEALAYQNGSRFSHEHHEQIQVALENRDYNAWKELVSGRRVSELITEENFARFAEAHDLAKAGKYEEAREIREELGLKLRNGNCLGR